MWNGFQNPKMGNSWADSPEFVPKAQGKSVCSMCPTGAPSVARCITCRRSLCQCCHRAHGDMLCFSTHKVVMFSDELRFVDKAPKCARHPTESLSFVCKTCANAIFCIDCIEASHAAHSYDSLVDSKASAKAVLKNCVSEGNDALRDMGRLSEMLEHTMGELGRHRLKVIKDYDRKYEHCVENLRRTRDDFMGVMETDCSSRMKLLKQFKQQMDESIEEFSPWLAEAKSALGDQRGTLQNAEGRREGTNGTLGPFDFRFDSDEEAVVPAVKAKLPIEGIDALLREIVNFGFLEEDTGNGECPSTGNPSPVSELVRSPSTSPPIQNDPVPCTRNHINTVQVSKTFGQRGSGSGQFNSPHGFCFGIDEDIVVADTANHRVQIFDKYGNYKRQFGLAGRHDGQLWYPRKLALMPLSKRFAVCDRGFDRSRLQIFTEQGRFVKKIHVEYIEIVAGITVTEDDQLVLIESVTPTLFVIGLNDTLKTIDLRDIVNEPSDIAIFDKEFYVCDFKGHCVVVLDMDGNLKRRIGNGSITNFPNGIDMWTATGDILTGDSHGNYFHISMYTKSGVFVSEHRCPYVKVSRCCGLKLNSKGQIVTVDKNFHHVIVLNSLFKRG